jgi:hypothetical protein
VGTFVSSTIQNIVVVGKYLNIRDRIPKADCLLGGESGEQHDLVSCLDVDEVILEGSLNLTYVLFQVLI